MADFEEKLNEILSSPSAMEQIMALAGSLSGELGSQGQKPEAEPAKEAPGKERQGDPLGDLTGLLQGADLTKLARLLPLLGQFQQQEDDKVRLLRALEPCLPREKRDRLEQAMQLARLGRILSSALEQMGDEGHE